MPQLKEEDIDIKVTPDDWTKDPVTVTITPKINIAGYKLQYSLNKGSWKDYTVPFEVSENGTEIRVRVANGYRGTVRKEITNIDKIGPEVLEINLTPSKKSIQVNISNVKDAEGNEESGSSGIAEIKARLSKDGSTWTDYQNIDANTNTYTFDNIYGDLAGQECTIQVEAKDYAGNTKLVEQSATTTCKNLEYYVDEANKLISTVDGRKYYKYNTLGAIVINCYIIAPQTGHIWTETFYVSPYEEGVWNYCDCNSSDIGNAAGSMDYNGTRYYYTFGLYAWEYARDIISDYKILNDKEEPILGETDQEIWENSTKMLLDLYFKEEEEIKKLN